MTEKENRAEPPRTGSDRLGPARAFHHICSFGVEKIGGELSRF